MSRDRAHNNTVEWKRGPLVNEFLVNKVNRLSDRNSREFVRHLSAWIQYCCEVYGTPPESLNFAQCTVVRAGEVVIRSEIRWERVWDFLNRVKTPTAGYHAQRVLHSYFAFLVSMQCLSRNPVPCAKNKRYMPRPGLTIAEIQAFAYELASSPLPTRVPITIILASGLRLNEALNLRVDDVSHVEGRIIVAIRREAQKGRKAFMLPLPELGSLLTSYDAWKTECGLVCDYMFIDECGVRLGAKKLRSQIAEIGRRAHLRSNITPHDLRHVYATLVASYVQDPDILRRCMRHQSASTSFDYVSAPPQSTISKVLQDVRCYQLADEFADTYLSLKSD